MLSNHSPEGSLDQTQDPLCKYEYIPLGPLHLYPLANLGINVKFIIFLMLWTFWDKNTNISSKSEVQEKQSQII